MTDASNIKADGPLWLSATTFAVTAITGSSDSM
jgi:hypothetical protein